MITGYNKGADITLLNTIYQKPKRISTGKYSDDVLTIIYRDNVTGKKHHQDIVNPTYEFYVANDDVYVDYNMQQIDKSKAHPVTVPYKNILKEIADITNNKEFYYDNLKNRRMDDNKHLHEIFNIFNSDMDINDHYRVKFSQLYKDTPFKISKSYLDIETDNIQDDSDFPELGKFPINAISFISDQTKTVYSYALRSSVLPNPQIKEFENKLKSNPQELLGKLKNFIIDHVGGFKQATRFGIIDFEYEIRFFDEEIELISDLFNLINHISPDFLLAWNMPFDIPYIHERCYTLGYDPNLILSHRDFKYPCSKYWIDTFHTEFEKRGDSFEISGNTVYIDQLVNFASRRAGTKFSNYKLDYIGNLVTGVGKLDYSHLTNKVPELAYKNYETFLFYNIADTILQKCIETKTGDLDYMFMKCLVSYTRYTKCHRQSIYLINRATKEFINDGDIIGNNINKFNVKKDKYVGALVGDPMHVSDDPKITIGGEVVNISRNNVDNDYKSLYPSETLQHNIGANTQIGRIMIDNKIYKYENPNADVKYSRGGQFIEDLHSNVTLEFCSRWLHFASYRELMEDVEEYFKYKSYHWSDIPVRFNKDEMMDAIINCGKIKRNAILVNNFKEVRDAIIIKPPKINYNKYLEDK